MTDDPDPETDNPLTGLGTPGDEGPETDEYRLTDVIRGRMFCLPHGRECYRRVTIVGESEWVCPDERHLKPIRSS